MRSLEKNKVDMWYALYDKKVPAVDENGDLSGNYDFSYLDPVKFRASLSAGKGSAQKEVFGVYVDFTKTISTTDLTLPITETSLVWYETEPVMKDDGTVDADSADYTVSAPPAKGLNELVIALKARTKSSN